MFVQDLLPTPADVARVHLLLVVEADGFDIDVLPLQSGVKVCVVNLADACRATAVVHYVVAPLPFALDDVILQMGREGIQVEQAVIG